MELAITTIDEKAGLIEKYSAIGDSVSEEARVILKEIEQYDKQILREFNRVKTNIEAERNKNKRNLKDYTTTKKVLTKYAPYGGVVHNGSYIDKKK